MSVRKWLATVVSIIMLVVLFNALPATAQTIMPEGETTPQAFDKPCIGSDPSLSRYDRWVMDIPCAGPEREGSVNSIAPVADPGNSNYTTVIAFSRYIGNWEIYYKYDPLQEGSLISASLRTNNSNVDIQPRVRPGTADILYASKPTTGVYNLILSAGTSYYNDFNVTKSVTHNSTQGAWSPNASTIVYVSDWDGNQEIYTIQKDGTHMVRLTFDNAADFNPQYSPDGNKIVWLRAVSKDFAVIYVMNADGSNQHPITLPLRYLQHPLWSPDGNQIAFDHDQNGDNWNDLAIVNADGGNYRLLASKATVDYYAGSFPDISTNNNLLLITEIHYVFDSDQWWIDTMWVVSIELQGNHTRQILSWQENYDQMPDLVTLDHVPPVTRVNPLPKYVRSGTSFPLIISGTDSGIAKLIGYELQYKDLTSHGDTNWFYISNSWDNLNPFPSTLNHGVCFWCNNCYRSRGLDWAGNWEEWPNGDGDTCVMGYEWDLNGSVVDNREISIPKPTVVTNPVLDDQENGDILGNFHRYVSPDEVNVSLAKPGYKSLNQNINKWGGEQHQWSLATVNNLVNNGDFENALNYWTRSGKYNANITSFTKYTGSYSAIMGQLAIQTQSTKLTSDGNSTNPRNFIDANGNSHLIWQNANGIKYKFRSNGSSWGATTSISSEGIEPEAVLASDGSLYVVWKVIISGQLKLGYAFRNAAGVWTPATDIGGLRDCNGYLSACKVPKIAVDSLNTVHIVWGDFGGTWYAQKTASGAWSTPRNINLNSRAYAIAIDPSDKLFLFYLNGAYFVTRSADGTWTSPVTTGIDNASLTTASNSSGGIHTVWGLNYPQYSMLLSDGSWFLPVVNVFSYYSSFPGLMAVDGDDAHFISFNGNILYRRRYGDGTWSPIIYLANENMYEFHASLAARGDHIEVAWVSFSATDTDIRFADYDIDQIANSTIQQEITIPPNLNKPTLSFMSYSQQLFGTGGSLFQVKVNETVVYSSSDKMDEWQHHWVDLSPWLGQTITLKFNNQTDFQKEGTLTYLDEISIGEWLTPIVTSVTPDKNLNSTGAKFIVTGENFLNGATIKLSSFPASSVTWVDEHTMTFTLDAGFQPGFHDVWVINPGGQENVKQSVVQVGEPFFLPAVMR